LRSINEEDGVEIVKTIWRHIVVNKEKTDILSGGTWNNYNFFKTQRNIEKITESEPTCPGLSNHTTKTENGSKLRKLLITSLIR